MFRLELKWFVALMSALFLLQGCGGNDAGSSAGIPVELRYAENLKITEHAGYTEVEIRNPWDTTRLLRKYALLEEGTETPRGFMPDQILRVPLKNAVIFSSVHNGLVEELGSIGAISGVCDAEYIFSPELKSRIGDGIIADCGNSMSPNVERIITLNPGAVFISPFENATGNAKLERAGIPVVDCADYMETSPLARAEWMKFYGRLFGKKEKADSLFEETEREYLELKESASASENKPKVLFDRIYGQTWNLPAGNSTTGRLIIDAGGINPYADVMKSGSLKLSPEKVLVDAGDADIWLIRFAYTPLTLKSLASDKPLYSRFKAYKTGNVYGSDSSKTRIFEDFAFHPQWLLRNLISLFHPEIPQTDTVRAYFTKIPDQ